MRPEQGTLARVRSTVREVLGDRHVEVYLFGSWAHGDPSRASDIDIGLLPREEIPPGLLARLREALEESHVPYPVEVVDLRDVDPVFRHKIVQEGISWSA